MDPHHPYDTPVLGPWEDPDDARAAELRRTWRALPFDEQTARMQAVASEDDLDAATRAFLVDRYDAEIRRADAGVAALLGALAQRGATRANTWVAVTADHGEELLDHGKLLHGHTLYDELLHVPLIVRGPRTPPGCAWPRRCRAIDLAATLLDAAGQATDDLDARPLAPFWEAPGREPERAAIASREGKYLAFRAGGHKLVIAQAPPPPVAARSAA
jgi:arylsulfatase